MQYRIVFRSIGRDPAEAFADHAAAEALYTLLSGDTRIVSVALYLAGDDLALKSHDRSRPVLRATETIQVIHPANSR